jgi:hypothetical protein
VPKRGLFPPFGKGREEGFYNECLYTFALLSKLAVALFEYMTTIREKLCRNFCPYYKPLKDEELACLGFTVVERLSGKGWAISFDTHDKGFEEQTKKVLLEALCAACPFFENDCDFVTGSSNSPCGGFTLLGLLLDKKVIHIDDIKNII